MFKATLQGSLLGVSESDMRDGGKLRTYMIVSETDVLKLYTADRDGDAGEFHAAISKLKRPCEVRVEVEVRQDNNGKTKLRPLAVTAVA